MARMALLLSLMLVIGGVWADLPEAVVSVVNELYRTTVDEGNNEFYALRSTLASKEEDGTANLVLLLDCLDTGAFSLHCLQLNTADNALDILAHSCAPYFQPSLSDLSRLDSLLLNLTNTTALTTLFTDKQTLNECTGFAACNFTLVSRGFLNGSEVVTATAVSGDGEAWTLYLDRRNATVLDQLASAVAPEPLYYYVFAGFVGVVLTYASLAYFWQRTNSLPFLKRRLDQHLPFDMNTGRSQS